MTIIDRRTIAINALDSTPIVRANPWVHGGNSKQFAGTVQAMAGDSVGSTYRMFRVGSWMRPVSLLLFCDAIGGAADLGLYRTASDGGDAVKKALFASAHSMADAVSEGQNIRFEADDIANIEKRVWELLGLSADPNLEYDVTLTAVSMLQSSGTLALQGTFSW